MGANTLSQVTGTSSPDDVDQYYVAITGDFLPRDPVGGAVETAEHSLGSQTAEWKNAYLKNLFIDGALFDPQSVGSDLDLTNAIVTGKTRTDSGQPDFIRASGSGATCTILATATPLQITAGGVSATFSADIAVSSLTVAPASNNTALINDATLADQLNSKYVGEQKDDPIYIDTAGTEITNRVGQFICLKASTEYMLAFVESATVLRDVKRGFFFDSSGAPIVRELLSNNDTLTIMSLGWVFLDINGSTVDVSYTSPIYSTVEPASPATDDYWFDMTARLWMRYDGADFQVVDRMLIGLVVIDGTNCVASRSFDFTQTYSDFADINLIVESATVIAAQQRNNTVSVYNRLNQFNYSDLKFDITTDLESGLTEANSTLYYLYITEKGAKKISVERPLDRTLDLKGLYHPYHSWRCVGMAFNNSSGNLVSCRQLLTNQRSVVYSKKEIATISEINLQGFFRLGFDYIVTLHNSVMVDDGIEMHMQFEVNSAIVTATNYNYAATSFDIFTSTVLADSAANHILLANGVGSVGAEEDLSGEVRVFNPCERGKPARANIDTGFQSSSAAITRLTGSGKLSTNYEVTGARLYGSSGNVESYQISIEEIPI